jgi:tetratricopeptide (TPR) repeat protein
MEQKVANLNIGERLWVWFEANKKQTLWGALIVVVVGLIVSFYLWQESEKEANAGEALSQVMANTASSGGTRAESPDAYLKVASQHSGSSAGAQALLLAGEAYFEAGKYAEAQAQFQRFTREYMGNPLTPQALLGTASSLDAQGKTEEAARAYKEAFERNPNSNIAPQAKFSLARIYESQNKLDQARSLYVELARADTSIGNEAGMRLEELKVRSPAPSLPPATIPILSTPKTN